MDPAVAYLLLRACTAKGRHSGLTGHTFNKRVPPPRQQLQSTIFFCISKSNTDFPRSFSLQAALVSGQALGSPQGSSHSRLRAHSRYDITLHCPEDFMRTWLKSFREYAATSADNIHGSPESSTVLPGGSFSCTVLTHSFHQEWLLLYV